MRDSEANRQSLVSPLPELSIRAARAEDLEQIPGWLGREEVRWWGGPATGWPVTIADLRRWHDESDVYPYVLVSGGELAGFGEVWLDLENREVELARLVVRPDLRRRGVGKHLVSRLVEEAAAFGMHLAFLRVDPGNMPALACYSRCGFARVPADEERRYNEGQALEYIWLSAPIA